MPRRRGPSASTAFTSDPPSFCAASSKRSAFSRGVDGCFARHQPDHLDERRHAGAGWRHPAFDVPVRNPDGGLRRHRARREVPARTRRIAADPRGARPAARLGLVQRTALPPIGRAGAGRCCLASRLVGRDGLQRHGVCRGSWQHGWRSVRAAFSSAGALRRAVAGILLEAQRRRGASASNAACGSRSITTWAPSCRRKPRSIA